MTVKSKVYTFLDNEPEQVYSLWGLTDTLGAITGTRVMPHTVQRYCREYADASGAKFFCIDRKHSKYKYVPGFKIAGALTDK